MPEGCSALINDTNLLAFSINGLWGLTGLVFGISFRSIRSRASRLLRNRRVAAAASKSFIDGRVLAITGSRFEIKPEQCTFNLSDEKFIVDFPTELRDRLHDVNPEFEFGNFQITHGMSDYLNAAMDVIPNLNELIALSRYEVAEDFIVRAARADRLFNGAMFHPLRMGTSAEYDFNERVTIFNRFYKTDYYTNQVLHKVFLKVKNNKRLVDHIASKQLTPALRFFMNGYGLNLLVCAVGSKRQGADLDKDAAQAIGNAGDRGVLIFAQRSSRVSKTSATGCWNATVKEGFTKSDIVQDRVSLGLWTARALEEEAAIKEKEIGRTYLLCESLNLLDMQPGLLGLVMCYIDFESFQNRIPASQDGTMEFCEHIAVAFSNDELQKILDENGIRGKDGIKRALSPSTEHLVRNIVARGVENF